MTKSAIVNIRNSFSSSAIRNGASANGRSSSNATDWSAVKGPSRPKPTPTGGAAILRAQGSGHVITVSSVGGIIGFPTGGTYTATKFAVEAMSEGLAAEVAPFGIKVTILEPGHFSTGFRSASQSAPAIDAYNPIRQAVRSSFKPEDFGDPAATSAALFDIVDSQEPPLRLVLGSKTIAKFRSVYETRLATWQKWEDLSNAAQGRPAA